MPPGEQTIGRYEIVEMIGQGGMGRVYRARDPLIDRIVAIKTIEFSAAPGKEEDLRQRILREVRAAGRLLHPNIVQVFDVGELPDKAYIVMELVEGRTLWELYDADERPAPVEAVKILQQVGAALDYAHEQGIIHRDVKPGNILIDARGAAKITDFGIARILTDERLTQTGMIVGTPHYMAPEQLQETGVGPAADQFALAVNAYELLSGQKPFDGESFSSLLYMVLNEDPPSFKEVRPDLPPSVEPVLAKALAKDRGGRYANCTEFANALAGALAGESRTIQTPIGAAETLQKPKTWALAALAAAMAAAAIGMSGLRDKPATEPPRAAATAPEASTGEPLLPEEPTPITAGPLPEPRTVEPEAPPAAVVKSEPPAAPEPQPPASAPAPEVAAGPTVTVVWRGRLEPGETLVIEDGAPSAGSLSRPLPREPMSVEVSPSNVEVLEAPGPRNNWKTLRVRNTDHPRTMFFVRYRQLDAAN